jgi:transposase
MAYLVFLDESGFLLIPTVRRTWAPRGQTPVLRHRYRRDKISTISAVSVSPRRQRCGLYAHFHLDNITQVEVALFLQLLLRHLHGQIILLWDGGSIHNGPAVDAVLARHPRLHVERFPAYAPELNPDEFVWDNLKLRLASGAPENVEELMNDLTHELRCLRHTPTLLRSFIIASELPSLFLS